MHFPRRLMAVLAALALLLTCGLWSRPNTAGAAESSRILISAPDGTLFLLYDQARHKVTSSTLAAFGINEQTSQRVTREIFDTYPETNPVPDLPQGSLVTGPDGWPYLLYSGLHPVPNVETFYASGWGGYQSFGPNAIATIDAGLFALIPQHAPLTTTQRTGPGLFEWGNCTWWVAQRRAVTWLGNGGEWYANAQAQGYAVGSQPMPGAILVRGGSSGYGHVAYVESVDGTSFTISEMNVAGLGQLSTRTYDMGSNPPPNFIGFVYWQFDPETPTITVIDRPMPWVLEP